MTIPPGEVAELLQTLIRNACVNDGTPASGGEVRSADTLDAYLGVAGTRFEPAPGRVSVLYRIPASRPAPTLTLLAHTDVVPADPGSWKVPPFDGERRGQMIWGRGAVDMLDQTAAMAAVFLRHARGEARYPGELRLLAVADEEAGGRFGARHLVAEHWDEVGTDYLLTEIATPTLPGRLGRGIPVTVAEKGPQWRRLRSRGVAGHGSQPYGARNALVPLARAAAALGDTPTPVRLTEEWRRFVSAWAPEPELERDLLDPNRIDGAIHRLAGIDPGLARWVHACTHLTVSPNRLEAGVKANVIPDSGVLEVDVRVLPGQGSADVSAHFCGAVGPGFDDLDYQEVESTPAGGSVPAGPLWEAVREALAAVAPGHHPVPTMIPVGTDARFFRPRGTVAYGFGLFDDSVSFGEFLSMFHGHDERVSVPSLGATADVYLQTLARLGDLV